MIIDDATKSQTKPIDIKIWGTDCAGHFGKNEVEQCAGTLVQFFQEKGEWGTFTLTELEEYSRARGKNSADYPLLGLFGDWGDSGKFYNPGNRYIVELGGNRLAVTAEFIRNCLEDGPVAG